MGGARVRESCTGRRVASLSRPWDTALWGSELPTPLPRTSLSPTIHRERGYRFSFYSREADEPPHVHVEKAGAHGKLWLTSEGTLSWAYSEGFTATQRKRIEGIVSRERIRFLEAWYEHFNDPSSGDRGEGD